MEFVSINRGARALFMKVTSTKLTEEGEMAGFAGDAPIPEVVAVHLQH